MFEILMLLLWIGPAVASIMAAVYANKAYEIVKMERDIRIAREAVEVENGQ